MRCALALLLVAPPQTPAGDAAIRADYVRALGGEPALRALTSRITEGSFDNGRGLRDVFRLYEKAPNKRLTTIGREPITSPQGSGRGYDGAGGWDKNFIGTGLRPVEGRELADLARDADFFAPLRLLDACSTIAVDPVTGNDKRVSCRLADGRTQRYVFDGAGLLTRRDVELPDGGTVSLRFEDYRRVDAIVVPFRTSVVLPDGNVVTYATEKVTHNAPIDDGVFARPAR